MERIQQTAPRTLMVKSDSDVQKSLHIGWIEVISDAEQRLLAAKTYVDRLKASIRVFKRAMEAGDSLPEGLNSEQNVDQPKCIRLPINEI